MSEHDLRTLLHEATEDAPLREWSPSEIVSAARRRARRRTTWLVSSGSVLAASVAAVAFAVSLADPPAPTGSASGVAVGFTVSSAVDAVSSALPSGTVIGELPMDIAWTDGSLTLPLRIADADAMLTVSSGEGCTATSEALTSATLEAISAAVCEAKAIADSVPLAPPQPGGGGPAS